MSTEYRGKVKIDQVPVSDGGSKWKKFVPQWRKELVDADGDLFFHTYEGVGTSTASNLKRDYGVVAESHKEKKDGKDIVVLYVRFPAVKNAEGVYVVDEDGTEATTGQDGVKAIRAKFKANKPAAKNGAGTRVPATGAKK